MIAFNKPPLTGYYPPTTSVPAPAPTPGPTPATPPAYYPSKGLSPEAALDLARMVKHPIQTIKSLYTVSKDLLSLHGKRGLTIASADPAIAEYRVAQAHLDEAPFQHLIPFFQNALDRWADARFYELKPQVEAKVSERAWHPIQLLWPDGGAGGKRLDELSMFKDVAQTATDGQIVRALQGVNYVRVTDSSAMDYFYPVAREGDALILRRNLPLVPGQKPLAESLKGVLEQSVQVHTQIQ